MSSANIIFGKNLEYYEFKEWVLPSLGFKAEVVDAMEIPFGSGPKILTSLVSEELSVQGLEDFSRAVLIYAGRKAEHKDLCSGVKLYDCSKYFALVQSGLGKSKVPMINAIGFYQNNETASRLFPVIAQDLSFKGLSKTVEKSTEEIGRSIKKNLGNLVR